MSVALPERVLVVGGGAMAAGIAARLLTADVATTVLLRRPEAAEATHREIDRRVAQLLALGVASGPIGSVLVTAGPVDGPFPLVVESIAEEVEAKRAALARAETLTADLGVLATNTSSLSLGDIGRDLARPDRFAGWHWFNPAELVPLVEVVSGPSTSPDVLEWLTAFSTVIGKQPITVRRDVPGFVANRLQYALLREAYALVEAGVCDMADVDRAVVAGLGARWAAIGPFTAMDAAGLDVHEAVAAQLFPRLARSVEIPAVLRGLRAAGALGVKGGAGLRGAYPPDAARRLAERRDATLALLADPAREVSP
ncbi:MAG: 3-hydroxybutyryl-CoA dehydrogenase [Streptomyces sp.]|nr:3-hydroxybutyryl-CoA dehydrogenase [Streptomyces sp.]